MIFFTPFIRCCIMLTTRKTSNFVLQNVFSMIILLLLSFSKPHSLSLTSFQRKQNSKIFSQDKINSMSDKDIKFIIGAAREGQTIPKVIMVKRVYNYSSTANLLLGSVSLSRPTSSGLWNTGTRCLARPVWPRGITPHAWSAEPGSDCTAGQPLRSRRSGMRESKGNLIGFSSNSWYSLTLLIQHSQAETFIVIISECRYIRMASL